MIRKICETDREIYFALMDEFYHSPGVAHTIPTSYYERTFHEILSGSPFADAFLIESDGRMAGYGQLSFTYSNEAGGLVAWVEELYIRPEFQGKGLGSEFFAFIREHYDDKIARYRLEIEPDNSDAERLYKRLGYSNSPYRVLNLERNPSTEN